MERRFESTGHTVRRPNAEFPLQIQPRFLDPLRQATYSFDDFSNINLVKHYRLIAFTGGIGIAASLLLYAAKTDGINVMTGPKAFTNTASLSPGLARKISAQDLPQPQPP